MTRDRGGMSLLGRLHTIYGGLLRFLRGIENNDGTLMLA